jgi:pSer/pThr/pTyr-binding forkhead associated (FHA) protein
MSARLCLYLDRYELLPIRKRDDSPWQERILIGRAPNNDIILRDASVSKSHAHFSQGPGGAWVLIAKKSRNGTFVDGRPLGGGESAAVRSGSALEFGNVRCELIESGALFDSFTR